MKTGNEYLDRKFNRWRMSALMFYLYQQAESSPVVDASKFERTWPSQLNRMIDDEHRKTLNSLALRRKNDSDYSNSN